MTAITHLTTNATEDKRDAQHIPADPAGMAHRSPTGPADPAGADNARAASATAAATADAATVDRAHAARTADDDTTGAPGTFHEARKLLHHAGGLVALNPAAAHKAQANHRAADVHRVLAHAHSQN